MASRGDGSPEFRAVSCFRVMSVFEADACFQIDHARGNLPLKEKYRSFTKGCKRHGFQIPQWSDSMIRERKWDWRGSEN